MAFNAIRVPAAVTLKCTSSDLLLGMSMISKSAVEVMIHMFAKAGLFSVMHPARATPLQAHPALPVKGWLAMFAAVAPMVSATGREGRQVVRSEIALLVQGAG